MEDISPNHECLADYIKEWTDHYGYIAEDKHGGLSPKYSKFYITS